MTDASKTFLEYYPYGRAEFQFTLSDVANLDKNGKNSGTYATGDADWHLNVCANNTKKGNFLSTFVFCDAVDIVNAWEIHGQFRIVLENKKSEKQSIARQMDFQFECEKAENRGWNTFVECDDVMDPDKGFLVDGGLSFRVMVGINSVKGFDSPKYFNFTVQDKDFSDGTIVVNGYTFHVNKTILAVHSPVLGKLLLDAAEGADVVINDLDRHEFADYLQMLYAVPIRIHKNNVASILKMSARFETVGIKNMCSMFLLQAESEVTMSTAEVVKIAEENRMDDILDRVINAAKNSKDLVKKFEDLNSFSIDTLKKVVSKTLTLA